MTTSPASRSSSLTPGQFQLGTRLLSAGELKTLVPDMEGHWQAALHTPSDGRAEPRLAGARTGAGDRTPRRTHRHRMRGRGLDLKRGRVAGVVTEHGITATSSVVLAGGIWSSLFCGNHDIALPQLRIQNNVMRTTPARAVFEGAIWADDLAIRRREDGGYTVAHGYQADFHLGPDALRWMFDFMPAYRQEKNALTVRFSRQSLRDMVTRKRWLLDDTSPLRGHTGDEPEAIQERDPRNLLQPASDLSFTDRHRHRGDLGRPDRRHPGRDSGDLRRSTAFRVSFSSTGFSGHGFGIGPGAGRVTAELVTGQDPFGGSHTLPVSPFRRWHAQSVRKAPARSLSELTHRLLIEIGIGRAASGHRHRTPERKLAAGAGSFVLRVEADPAGREPWTT